MGDECISAKMRLLRNGDAADRTKHHASAGRKGNATIAYYTSGATPGYKVTVSVSVVKGSRTGHCSTSFTPHR